MHLGSTLRTTEDSRARSRFSTYGFSSATGESFFQTATRRTYYREWTWISSMDSDQRQKDGISRDARVLEWHQKESIPIFQRKLLQWYGKCGRDLPWRHTRDPYHILVSEMMLHQTQVARVIEKYHEWLATYPTFEALASAPLEEVKQLWRPLGYNFRPERLHQIAKLVVSKFDGELPSGLEELMAFRGIGRYTAGAILSFAFHKDAPLVDTNVRRIITRIFGIRDNLNNAYAKRRVWQVAEIIIPAGKGYIFNQALMDFGALVCRARDPECPVCFVNEICAWEPTRERSK